jgi:hypothetical protein
MNLPPRPFYKRKRWIAAGVHWLGIAYPLSLGPLFYAAGNGWIRRATIDSLLIPIEATIGLPEPNAGLTPANIPDDILVLVARIGIRMTTC